MSGINIEIGPRTNPRIDWVRDNLKGRGLTVFLDKRYAWQRDLQKNQRSGACGKLLIQAAAEEIPLPENSVSLIYAGDFFGAHGQYTIVERTPAGNNTKANEIDLEMENIGSGHEKEWARVCKKGGHVVIAETSEPSNKERIIGQFKKSGFRLIKEYSWREIGKIYKEPYSSVVSEVSGRTENYRAYSLVFEKM